MHNADHRRLASRAAVILGGVVALTAFSSSVSFIGSHAQDTASSSSEWSSSDESSVPSSSSSAFSSSVAPSPVPASSSRSSSALCTDTDGGEYFTVKGTVLRNGVSYVDFCQNATLIEYVCTANGSVGARSMVCAFGCSQGRCLSSPTSSAGSTTSTNNKPQCNNGIDDNRDGLVDMQDFSCKNPSQKIEGKIERCSDTDGGNKPNARGEVIGYESPNIVDRWTDYCGTVGQEAGKLVEYVCKSNQYGEKVLVTCPEGCHQGACRSGTVSSTAPDLAVQFLRFVKESSDLYTIEFDVVNVGKTPVKDWFSMAVYIDGSIYTHTYYIRQKEGTSYTNNPDAVIPIPPGGRYHVTLSNYQWLATGTHTVRIVVDAVDSARPLESWVRGILRNNMIVESNELNNAVALQASAANAVPPSPSAEPAEATPANRFRDLNATTLEGQAANDLAEREILDGFPDGEFKGKRSVNRAEAAKLLLLARYGTIPNARNNGRFPDVQPNQWYEKYVMYAEAKGIITGHADGYYRPENGVNTAEFLKMLSHAFDLPLYDVHSYEDVPGNSWFAPYAGIARSYKLFPYRHASYLQPSRELTREEVAIALYQYFQKAEAASN